MMRLFRQHPEIVVAGDYQYELRAAQYWLHLVRALSEVAPEDEAPEMLVKRPYTVGPFLFATPDSDLIAFTNGRFHLTDDRIPSIVVRKKTAAPAASPTLRDIQSHVAAPQQSLRNAPGGLNAVLVSGMHRSGTSAVGNLLASMGVYDGPANGHLPPTLENPAGYAELQQVMEFNDQALEMKGWLWDAPPAMPGGDARDSRIIVTRGRRLVDANLTKSPWFVKDPRLSLLLPLWRKILLDRFVVVFTIRPALEVAWSLAVRDGFSISLGLALWAAYYRHLALGLNGLSAIAVDYLALTTQPLETTRLLIAALKTAGLSFHVEAETAAAAILPALRRGTVPSQIATRSEAIEIEDLFPGWPSEPVVYFDRFEMGAREPQIWESDILDEHRLQRMQAIESDRSRAEAARLIGERDQLAAERDALTDAREQQSSQHIELIGRRDVVEAERDALAVEFHQMTAERDVLRAERDELSAQRNQLTAERDQLAAERDELTAERNLLTAESGAVSVERDSLAAERDEVIVERDTLIVERNQLTTELGELTVRRNNLIVERDQLIAERDDLRRDVQELHGRIHLYEDSTSWRVTAAGRALGRAIRSITSPNHEP